MIAQVSTKAHRARFLNACRGKWVLGATLPLDLALFSKSQPWRFYAGPTLALELSGSTAWAAGHANPEELASFLAFCGCESIILDENECPPPAGWCKAKTLTVFGLAPGKALPLPAADETLWAGLTLDREPSAMDVARALYPADTAKQEDFYSELCTKRTRGKALVWALRQGSETICTVGAYALANRQAYMACGQTAQPLRGKGMGGSLCRWRTSLPPKGSTRCFSAARSGCTFIPGLALKSLRSMRVMNTRRVGSFLLGETTNVPFAGCVL